MFRGISKKILWSENGKKYLVLFAIAPAILLILMGQQILSPKPVALHESYETLNEGDKVSITDYRIIGKLDKSDIQDLSDSSDTFYLLSVSLEDNELSVCCAFSKKKVERFQKVNDLKEQDGAFESSDVFHYPLEGRIHMYSNGNIMEEQDNDSSGEIDGSEESRIQSPFWIQISAVGNTRSQKIKTYSQVLVGILIVTALCFIIGIRHWKSKGWI
ncbi:MAG: hypothetical protein IK020_00085 [Clostridiales bacterium]|nr:hypothetical protein [Clostridiales bacterium]